MPRREPKMTTVVLPVRDALATLADQLDALDRQEHAGCWEAIVVDNGSTDGGELLAHRWVAKRPWARVVVAAAFTGPGYARNVGAAHARGDFLAFCDADDVVDSNWLAELTGAATRGDLVAGRNDTARLNSPPIRSCHDEIEPGQGLHGFLPILDCANGGLWSAVWRDLGGFATVRSGEDVDLAWRAQLAGYRLAAADGARVHVRLRTRPRAVAHQFFIYGRGDAWLYRRYAAAGMQRRTRAETLAVWRWLVRTAPRVRSAELRCRWAQLLGLSVGRLAGSIRQRVLFT